MKAVRMQTMFHEIFQKKSSKEEEIECKQSFTIFFIKVVKMKGVLT